jgi:DNA-binding transcriptional regulator YiaG
MDHTPKHKKEPTPFDIEQAKRVKLLRQNRHMTTLDFYPRRCDLTQAETLNRWEEKTKRLNQN